MAEPENTISTTTQLAQYSPHGHRGQQRNHRQDVDADVTVADVVDHARSVSMTV